MSATGSAGQPADSSTLLVVGSAPGLYDDLIAAKALYPFAEVMLVNEASGAVENADHVLAGHTDKAELFAAYRRQKFPECRQFRVHAVINSNCPPQEYPSVTDWWGHDCNTGASSAGKAARIGFKMGFSRVILCGCPMDGSGYFNPTETGQFKHVRATPRLGIESEGPAAHRYRRAMKFLADGEFKGRVFSMSGFTKQVLGYPC